MPPAQPHPQAQVIRARCPGEPSAQRHRALQVTTATAQLSFPPELDHLGRFCSPQSRHGPTGLVTESPSHTAPHTEPSALAQQHRQGGVCSQGP